MYQSLCVGIDETSFCLMNVQNNMTLSCVLANARVTQLVRLWNSKGRIKFLCKRNKECLLRRPSCSLCFSTSGIFLPRDHGVQSRRACSVIARLLATLDHLLKSKQYIAPGCSPAYTRGPGDIWASIRPYFTDKASIGAKGWKD